MSIGSHIGQVLRQGIWSSLTGGWYYEPSQTLFCNTFHMYLWLILVLTPFLLALTLGQSLAIWMIAAYSIAVAGLFLTLKLVVWHLHSVFDCQDPILEPISNPDDSISTDEKNFPSIAQSNLCNKQDEGMEMCILEGVGDREENGEDGGVTGGMSGSAPGLLAAGNQSNPSNIPSSSSRTVRIDPIASFSGHVPVDIHPPVPTDSPNSEDGLLKEEEQDEMDDVTMDDCLNGSMDGGVLNETSSSILERTAKRSMSAEGDGGQAEPSTSSTSVLGAPSTSSRHHHHLHTATNNLSAISSSSHRLGRKYSEPTSSLTFHRSANEGSGHGLSRGSWGNRRRRLRGEEECSKQLNEVAHPSANMSEGEEVEEDEEDGGGHRKLTSSSSRSRRHKQRANPGGSHSTTFRPHHHSQSHQLNRQQPPGRRRVSSGDNRQAFRRAQSSLDTHIGGGAGGSNSFQSHSSSFLLSQQTLEECKMKGTRKSYPSKTSSTDIFLSNSRPPLRPTVRRIADENGCREDGELSEDEEGEEGGSCGLHQRKPRNSLDEDDDREDQQPSARSQHRQKATPRSGSLPLTPHHTTLQQSTVEENGVEEIYESTPNLSWLFSSPPSSPSSATIMSDRTRNSSEQTETFRKNSNLHGSQRSISGQISLPLRPSTAYAVDEASTSSLTAANAGLRRKGGIRRHTAADECRNPSQTWIGMDLKENLKVFLEQIIESHPEALEAIESVRASRLGQDSTRSAGGGDPAEESSIGGRPGMDEGTETESASGGLAALATILGRSSSHIATSHQDTSQGSVHCFQDEEGKWWTYTFDAEGRGTAQAISTISFQKPSPSDASRARRSTMGGRTVSTDDRSADENSKTRLGGDYMRASGGRNRNRLQRRQRGDSSSSDESYLAQMPISVMHAGGSLRQPVALLMDRSSPSHQRGHDHSSLGEGQQLSTMTLGSSAGHFHTSNSGLGGSLSSMARESDRIQFLTRGSDLLPPPATAPQHKCYYSLNIFGKVKKRIQIDRLQVLALMDRNRSLISVGVDVLVATVVAFLGAFILRLNQYRDLWLFFYCIVLGGAQFSLLKSVQPDSSSPIHGYNWLVTYSRALYFTIFASASIMIHFLFPVMNSVLEMIILFLPLAFTLGLLPQANTFLLHIIEQIDMGMMGGTGCINILSGLFNAGKTLLSLSVIWTLTHLTLSQTGTAKHLAYSAVIGLSLAISYFLSRSTSNYRLFTPFFQVTRLVLSCKTRARLPGSDAPVARTSPKLFVWLDKSGSSCWGWGDCSALGCGEKKSKNQSDTEKNDQQRLTILGNSGSTDSGIIPRVGRGCGEHSKTSGKSKKSELGSASEKCKGGNSSGRGKKEGRGGGGGGGGGGGAGVNRRSDRFFYRNGHVVQERLEQDALICIFWAVTSFGLHASSAFFSLQPRLHVILTVIAAAFGFVNHYLFPQLRKQTPWLLLAQPILKTEEHSMFESDREAKLMWFERIFTFLTFLERNLAYPLVTISGVSQLAVYWTDKITGDQEVVTSRSPLDSRPEGSPDLSWLYSGLLAGISMSLFRFGFTRPQQMYWPLVLSLLLTTMDLPESIHLPPMILVYILAVIWPKVVEMRLKIEFVLAYIAPWQISWGSAFHAFAQPFALPHSALTLAQTAISSLISAPLNPFLGSSFLIISYIRPIKFWEKDYNTGRVDHSNTRLITQIERGPMVDDSNLNAIFYEHLTASLQKSLAGDIALGRWSTKVSAGDCFILASYYLNCLIHIVEVGNGFITFQMRGLEFRGTYCQQREVEAISEDIADGDGCCCCEPGRIPSLLSFNTAWALRWLAWEVTTPKYILEGYSITDNSAVSLLQVHELRRLLVTLYVKSMIYYLIVSPKLEEWLLLEGVLLRLSPIMEYKNYVDVDPMFCLSNDEDYDISASGISRGSFCDIYMDWISHCVAKRGMDSPPSKDSGIVALCFCLSLLGRRALGAAANNRHSSAAESFLYGLHALFKGDFRITSERDEWVFADMELLRSVVAPAVRSALKLHQDHFTAPEDFQEPAPLFKRMRDQEKELFISHEQDPEWREAILDNTKSLLALRHVYDDGQDDFKVIMLNKRQLTFRVIKLNKECVRSFWSGQQQELIFLRNRNPERGSIQNARQVLRNMINSSADQPIGYPIYVSPLTTSFIETHQQIHRVQGPTLSLSYLKTGVAGLWSSVRKQCPPSTSTSLSAARYQTGSDRVTFPHRDDKELGGTGGGIGGGTGGTGGGGAGVGVTGDTNPTANPASTPNLSGAASGGDGGGTPRDASGSASGSVNVAGSTTAERGGDSSTSGTTSTIVLKESTVEATSSGGPTAVRIGGHDGCERMKIEDATAVLSTINRIIASRRAPVIVWPKDEWRVMGGSSGWGDWKPEAGMSGSVVHRWTPSNPNPQLRSHLGSTILLLHVQDKYYVPIFHHAVSPLGDEL